jgi:membrane-bound metal-dependent hydrolase YbcI (DUF457 family)
MGLILLGVPIALIVSAINKDFFLLTILAYSSHIFLDYLCVFPARPLEPFSNKEYKKLGHGIFYPHYPKKWRDFVEKNKIRASDELIFGVLILILLVILVIFKGGILV